MSYVKLSVTEVSVTETPVYPLADGNGSINCDFSGVGQCGYMDESRSYGQKWMRRFDGKTSGTYCRA